MSKVEVSGRERDKSTLTSTLLKHAFYSLLPHTFWSTAYRGLTPSADKFLFIYLWKPSSVVVLTCSFRCLCAYFPKGKLNRLHICGLWPTYGKSLQSDILKWIRNHSVAKAGSCCTVRSRRFQEPPLQSARPPACFRILAHALSQSSAAHSAPWGRSFLKLQQTFILELRNSDLCF